MPIKNWSTTAASNNASPPNGFPEGMAPASLNDGMRQVMADVRSFYEDPSWIDYGDVPTQTGSNTFTIPTDVTARYASGLRIRMTGTTPFTLYGTISTSSYSAPNTTVTVTMDSGSLDSTLNAVALNFISFSLNNVAFTNRAQTFSAAQTLSATTTLSAALNESKGSNIASASTTDIGAATGNFVDVTGTTTITALGTVQAGTRRTVRFTGVLTLTHNATSLILPGGANITTANGDVAEFISLGSGNWVCTSYQRADGLTLSRPAIIQRVSSRTATRSSSSTAIPFDNTIPQITEGYELLTVAITPRSASSRLRIKYKIPSVTSSSASYVTACVFVDSTADALQDSPIAFYNNGTGFNTTMNNEFDLTAGSTSARTYRLRLGANAGTVHALTGNPVGNDVLGNTQAILFEVEEWQD